jgi:alkanesulfonate monooxygenase SsuD/methylene tetrahydromethanopterin reductase-like flavin-dependent oxidoreductase (luciferase family)
VFVNGTNLGHAARIVADLRARAGSRPLRMFAGATIVTAPTEAEARDRLEEYRRHTSVEGALAHAAASLGIDFSRFEMDQAIDAGESQAIQSNVESIAASLGLGWTKRMLIDRFILGSRQTPMVGSPSQVADALQRWVAEADVDGFNLSRTVIPECLEDFIDLIVPELQDRGAFKTEYALGTYREKLFGAGDRLPRDHPAAGERWAGP